MKIAISVYAQRIAPVFDTARDVLLVDSNLAQKVEAAEREIRIDGECLGDKVRLLVDHGVRMLVCGAISMPLQSALAESGIDVVSFVCGDVRDILQAVSDGRIERHAFTMPGCCGRRRGCRGGARLGRCHAGRGD